LEFEDFSTEERRGADQNFNSTLCDGHKGFWIACKYSAIFAKKIEM
jgi:hypothetical protein